MCLISRDYLASDFVIETEIPLIKKRAAEGAVCIPIFVSSCNLDNSWFQTMEGMNSPNLPISDISKNEMDKFFAQAERDIGKIADAIRLESNKQSSTHPKRAVASIDDEDMTRARYNIVLIGRTGTGKSALINYLFGAKLRESDTGRPVTQRGFHRQDTEIATVPATIFDSWGLETASAETWLQDLDKELEKRGTNQPVAKWFHTVIYCIQASSHRVEPFDTQIIRRFLRAKYRVIVALTKADAVSREALAKMDSIIHSEVGNKLNVIPVCSVEEVTMTGRTVTFGASELIEQIRRGFWNSIMDRVPARCVALISKFIDDECENIISYVKEQTGFFNHKRVALEVNRMLEEDLGELGKPAGLIERTVLLQVKKTLALYAQFDKLMGDTMLLKEKIRSRKRLELSIDKLDMENDVGGTFASIAEVIGLGSTISISSAILGFTIASVALPLTLGLGGMMVAYKKEKFVSSITESIQRTSEELKAKVQDLEPKIRKVLSSVPKTAA